MKNISLLVVIIFLLNFYQSACSQSYDLSTPENTVHILFKAMYEGDSIMAQMVFSENASLNSVFNTKEGRQMVNKGKVEDFIKAIGSPHDEIWDERISNLTIKIDGDLAQAWMDYSFFVGDKFSHCGVNAIHLIRIDDQWKIFQVVDTRRKVDCN
jgi:hypothetical protein